jgi:hypothetical protein
MNSLRLIELLFRNDDESIPDQLPDDMIHMLLIEGG